MKSLLDYLRRSGIDFIGAVVSALGVIILFWEVILEKVPEW